MPSSWTFGRKIGVGFAVIAILAALASVGGILSLRAVVAEKDAVVDVDARRLLEVEELRVLRERRAKLVRSFIISQDVAFVRDMHAARDELLPKLARLRETARSEEERALLLQVERANADVQAAWDEIVEVRRGGAPIETVSTHFTRDQGKVSALDATLSALGELERRELARAQHDATVVAQRAMSVLGALSAAATLLAAALAMLISRGLGHQIGGALQNIESSSAELEASANQQIATSRTLTSTTTEISTTIRELLATSRQIAESARHVVQIAEETGTSAGIGDATVQESNRALAAIQRQVDAIVGHMVNLGKKSHEIGGILELINELAEQTNILSINATIEAAGAGEAGRRFGVVADEIRRLADRVSGSARDVRALVEEIRSAANTTILATEDGSKAVAAGARQFSDVLASFKQIGDRVSLTTDAAREIELSTKQQTTAVEQVNVAIVGVTQVARETEASTRQTREASAQLTVVSKQLGSLVRRGAVSGGATH
ncbi:Methyl-accepting chemotaxis protein [Minicystis rosea]|nr:Methyl-accepting chemotaxis protein [Minicystis rosea]